MTLLGRWLTGPQPDGTASGVVAMAEAAAQPPPAELPPAAAPGGTVVAETIATKMLHGWLENRHQTLFPLAVNIRALSEDQRATLAQATAVFLLAGDDAPARAPRAQSWLQEAGAEADTLAALDSALANPPALSLVLARVGAQELAPYAYVAAVIALDGHDAAGAAMLEYLAARLALPATLVRSARRRFG